MTKAKTPKLTVVENPEPPKRHVRERVFVSAEEWQKRLQDLDRMNAKEREEFEKAKRLEITMTDHRIQAMALVRERFGAGEAGWERAAGRGAVSVSTFKHWGDEAANVQPRAQSLRKVAVALGKGYGFYDL